MFNIVSAVAGAVGAAQKNANIDRQIKAQQQESAATREWNLNLAKTQNQWNIEQWNRENTYNSPSAQMARFRDAGLNPDLMYGQENLSASSPQLTSGDGSTPTDLSNLANKSTIGDIMAQSAQNRLVNAQAKLAESQADKTDKETEGQGYTNEILKSDAKFRDALNSGQIDLNNMSLKVSDKDIELSDAQISTLRKQLDVMDANIGQINASVDEIRARISNMTQQQAINWLELQLKSNLNEATIKKLASDANLNYIQAQKIVKLIPHEIANIKANTNAQNASASESRARTTVAMDSLDTSSVLRSVLSGQSLDLSIKNSLNFNYLKGIENESEFIRSILDRTRGFIK